MSGGEDGSGGSGCSGGGAEPGSMPQAGLCAACRHARVIESGRGARFLRCGYSRVDPSFPKYPRLPVRECAAFAAPEPPEARPW